MDHVTILLQNLRAKQKRQQASADITAEQIRELTELTDTKKEAPSKR